MGKPLEQIQREFLEDNALSHWLTCYSCSLIFFDYLELIVVSCDVDVYEQTFLAYVLCLNVGLLLLHYIQCQWREA
jgi:hypothetical protein